MKQLSNSITVIKASLTDIKKYVKPAYNEVMTNYYTNNIKEPELKDSNDLRFRVPNDLLYTDDFGYKYTHDMLRAIVVQVGKKLEVNSIKGESIYIGKNCSHSSIGNNQCYPIIVRTPTQEIYMGRIHYTVGMYGEYYFFLTDNEDNRIGGTESYEVRF